MWISPGVQDRRVCKSTGNNLYSYYFGVAVEHLIPLFVVNIFSWAVCHMKFWRIFCWCTNLVLVREFLKKLLECEFLPGVRIFEKIAGVRISS